jgi:hypothetical protein|eukprot:COSAG02_NODE_14526_length_1262_cov_1.169390_2_plen_65_part_00
MNAALRFTLRLAVMVGLLVAFLYYRMELRAATEEQFDALNAERRKINEMHAARAREPPRMRTEM